MLTRGSIGLVPVLHGRVEFCRPLRRQIMEFSPEVLAIELPAGLESLYRDAILRFPRLSYITGAALEPAEEGLPLWKVEPTDPFCEAIRTALELEIPFRFVDRLVGGYPLSRDHLPDPYLVTAWGPGRYCEACRAPGVLRGQGFQDELDRERETAIASRLQALARGGRRVLFVGGLKHVPPLASLLESDLPEPGPPPELPALALYHPSLRTLRTLSEDVAFLATLYEIQRGGAGPEATWRSPRSLKEPPKESEPPRPETGLFDRESVFSSLQQLLGIKVTPEELKPMSLEQLRAFHAHLHSLHAETWVPPSFDDEDPETGPPPPSAAERDQFFVFRDCHHRREDLLLEYQRLTGECRTSDGELDRQLAYRALFLLAARHYQDNTGESLQRWQHDNFNRFVRRYAALQDKLLPGLLPLIYGARSCVDHNYAFEFWDLATFYPWQDEDPGDAPVFDFDGENLQINGLRLRHFEFHRTFPRLRQRLVRVPGAQREAPAEDPHDWSGAFASGHICSYPPEDLVIEDYGRYLQKKAIKVQSEAHSRTEPFTTSLLDGIDMRTTLRNWADGQKIFVREERKVEGGTGSVVLIFDDDRAQNRYPWCMTWHGEHDQESDMAFYSTDRRKKVVGPGIARCEYGGLMLSYPPRRLGNVWSDPAYRAAKTKAEVLLMAAIDYCLDKHVLYVASEAPRSFFFSFAQRLGKKLIYLPIGTLSPTSLERIRVFHVLAGHRYREMAKNYIW